MFRTIIEIKPSQNKISYLDHVMTLGSCFAENIGKKMKEVYFETDINPFGVLYNPVSIRNSIQLIIENKTFTKEDLFLNNGIWQCFSHSTLFSDLTEEKCLRNINSRLSKASQVFKNADYLLITFGTAWVFEEKESGKVVSNCHKLPANYFMRRCLSVDEIVSDYLFFQMICIKSVLL